MGKGFLRSRKRTPSERGSKLIRKLTRKWHSEEERGERRLLSGTVGFRLDLVNPHFVQFNGGFSQDQLDWVNEVLTYADKNQERVVIAAHQPIHPDSTNLVCLAWNYKAALSVIHSHHSVVCFLSGHLHCGGYSLDSQGIHHLSVEGIIETSPRSHAFGTIYVYDDRMILKGRGTVPDRVMYYRENEALMQHTLSCSNYLSEACCSTCSVHDGKCVEGCPHLQVRQGN